MDFRDFFIFIIRFALANLVLLYQLTSDARIINWGSSQVSRNLLFNLKSIQSVAVKMKSAYASEDCSIAIINLRETIEDHSFVDFCNALGRSCCMMYHKREINFNLNLNLLDQLNLFNICGSLIRNPDELVTFLESALNLVQTEHCKAVSEEDCYAEELS